jgi:myxalamid-type polyketide synthase MxaE and MxaD
MSTAAFDAALATKLRGAQSLDRLLPDLDQFVLFSSIGAILPQSGTANYAAANAGLDALAMNRRAEGKPAMSIAWGIWKGAGVAGEINMPEMARLGMGAIEGARAAKLFAWASGRSIPHLVVAPVDWERYAEARSGRTEPLLAELKVKGAAGSLTERLDRATAAERRSLIAGVIRSALAQTLKLAPDQIDPEREFGAMGLTSLLAMEFRNRLESQLGRALPATLAWNYPTVSALAAHLAGDATEPKSPTKRASIDATASASRIAAVSAMSDAEAFAALRRRGKSVLS